jgi:nicotinic acid phosphoribosyltransferase
VAALGQDLLKVGERRGAAVTRQHELRGEGPVLGPKARPKFLGERLAGVRLDSGDLVSLSMAVRRVLDEAGLDYVRIFASGGLDEEEVERCLRAGAPIDAFGVGTRMNVSADAPYLTSL